VTVKYDARCTPHQPSIPRNYMNKFLFRLNINVMHI